MDWQDLAPAARAAERQRREATGAVAARAAPEMAREDRINLAGMVALRCVPKTCTSTVPHVFVHGGGWVFGSSVQSLGLIRRIAWQTCRPVISVDYPLAPEHPYPAAIEAVTEALRQLEAADGLAGVIGASAGAQIVLHCLGRAPDIAARGAVLFCGAFGQRLDTASHQAFGTEATGLTTADMKRYLTAYAMPENMPAPDLTMLPPLFLSVGDRDPLLDDTLQIHAADKGPNGSALDVVPGAGHGFMNSWFRDASADQAVRAALDWLEHTC